MSRITEVLEQWSAQEVELKTKIAALESAMNDLASKSAERFVEIRLLRAKVDELEPLLKQALDDAENNREPSREWFAKATAATAGNPHVMFFNKADSTGFVDVEPVKKEDT